MYIFYGYDRIGNAASLDEAKSICDNYCFNQGVNYELKSELSDNKATVLIYQYSTLYLEVFVITNSLEL